jgi:hypothetical protein
MRNGSQWFAQSRTKINYHNPTLIGPTPINKINKQQIVLSDACHHIGAATLGMFDQS